jgi:hypothetical protein
MKHYNTSIIFNKIQESSACFINTFQIFYPDMFRHMVAILRGSWVPDKLLKQRSVLWACADYDPSRVASLRLATRDGSQSGVENLERINKIPTASLRTCWLFCKRYDKMLGSTINNIQVNEYRTDYCVLNQTCRTCRTYWWLNEAETCSQLADRLSVYQQKPAVLQRKFFRNTSTTS